MTRRHILFALAAASLLCTPGRAQTGLAAPSLENFDRLMTQTMSKWKLPGGSLAITYRGRLVFARGYGYLDRVNKVPAQPDSLFRIGSNSKTITAAAVLKLVQQKKLTLDQTVVDLLGPDLIPSAAITDPRWRRITVRHLLQHSGGWDEETLDFDPVLLTADVLEAFGIGTPVSVPPEQIRAAVIRHMATLPLHLDPGTRYSYSNFGYLLLGRVIERVSGRPYADFVQSEVLRPLGIRRAYQAGMPVTARRLGEADYYSYDGEPKSRSVYHADGRLLDQPDGVALADPLDSTGGWIISTIDLLRFATSLDTFLGPEIVAQIKARPSYELHPQQYMGLGWLMISLSPGEWDWFHDGAGSGTISVVSRGGTSGVAFAASFNSCPPEEQVNDLAVELYVAWKTLAAAVGTWPAEDQFTRYDPTGRPRLAEAGVVSAASALPGAISPGGIVSLFGVRLGPESGLNAAPASDGLYPKELGGVRVLFDGQPAPLLYVSEGQINAVAPYVLSGRSRVRVQVETAQGRSDELAVAFREQAPGLFTLSGNGRGPAAILNQDLSLNSATRPAARGETICLFLTGTGVPKPTPVDGGLAGSAYDFRQPVRVTVGGVETELLYAGAAPGLVNGVVQVNVKTPVPAPAGEVEVRLSVGDTTSRAGATVFLK